MACSIVSSSSGEYEKTLKQLFAQDLNPQKDFKLSGWGSRIGLINGDFWIPSPDLNTIEVINQEAELVKSIAHQNCPRSVCQASNGDVILASSSGLEVIDKDGKLLKLIKSGKFCDVSVDGDTFAALDYKRNEISVWKYGAENDLWRQISCFKEIYGYIDTLGLGTVLYFNNTVYCVSDPSHNTIDEYTKNGEIIEQHTQPNGDFIFVCEHNVNGEFITASYLNDSLILYQNSSFQKVNVAGIQFPRDVTCTPDGDCLWVLQGLRLVKYK